MILSSALNRGARQWIILILLKKNIGCAYHVYNTLGSGFLESVYEKCLIIEAEKCGLSVESQKAVNVYYDEQIVGNFIADLIIDKKVIIELKAVRHLVVAHEVQLVNYLTATKIPIGLLINFGETKVEVKRKFLRL